MATTRIEIETVYTDEFGQAARNTFALEGLNQLDSSVLMRLRDVFDLGRGRLYLGGVLVVDLPLGEIEEAAGFASAANNAFAEADAAVMMAARKLAAN